MCRASWNKPRGKANSQILKIKNQIADLKYESLGPDTRRVLNWSLFLVLAFGLGFKVYFSSFVCTIF